MRNLTIEELKQIAGGATPAEDVSASKADNGWGNGAEGTNNGSFVGLTEPSKSTESDVGSEVPNNNPILDNR